MEALRGAISTTGLQRQRKHRETISIISGACCMSMPPRAPGVGPGALGPLTNEKPDLAVPDLTFNYNPQISRACRLPRQARSVSAYWQTANRAPMLRVADTCPSISALSALTKKPLITQRPLQKQPQSPIFWSACELCDAASFHTPFSFTQVSVVRIVRVRCSPLIIRS